MPEQSLSESDHSLRFGQSTIPSSSQPSLAELKQHLADLQSQYDAATRRIAELEAQVGTSRARQSAANDTRLNTLLAVSAALLVTHEIEPILDMVVREAMALFANASVAILFMTDTTDHRLTLRATSGCPIMGSNAHLSIDLAHHAFRAPRAMLMAAAELRATLNGVQSDADGHCTRKHTSPDCWPPLSALLAPLRIEDQRMGALIVYDSVHDTPFQPHDLPFIQALADLAAVAITEIHQRTQAAALRLDLARTRSLHQEAQAQLNKTQAQLLQSAKLAAVGELAASVAHEINNPLYAARNSLYLVEQDLPADSPQQPFLEIAQNELGRIAGIITRMRDFYRPAQVELGTINVNVLLIETLELVQTHLRHSCVTVLHTLDEYLPPITAHADQLRQVFLNMMLNACDAMPEGGTLHVVTHSLPDSEECTASVIVRIADSGIGIPNEHIPHLFEPFYTTKPKGTGLGLAISAHIITQHAGQISVESGPGCGTTFIITLPC